MIKFELPHKTLKRIPVALMTLALGILSSCGNDPQVAPVSSDLSAIDLSIHLTSGSLNNTRNGLPEIFGTAQENKIALNDLKILLFDDSGTLKEILYDGSPAEHVELLQTGVTDYVLTARLDPARYTLADDLAVGVLANWNSMQEEEFTPETDVTTLSDLQNKAYLLNAAEPSGDEAKESWIPEGEDLIPMFGILHSTLKGYSGAYFNKGNPMDLGTVNLLRSVVKIEVIDNSDNEEVEITSVQLVNGRNTRGYLLPELQDKADTGQIDSPNIPGPPTTISSSEAGHTYDAISFHKDDGRYVAYVPEIRLSGELNERNHILVNIRYNDFDDRRYITLAPYDEDRNPFHPASGWPDEWKALLRNHIYRFTIHSITTDPNLELTVDVQPFSCVGLSADFGLERTEDGYIVVRNSQGEIIRYIRTDGSVLTMEEDTRWPYLGKFTGVFDSSKRLLIGYFEDGRSIIFNYDSDEIDSDDPTWHLVSWEIYSSPSLTENGRLIPEHLQEMFCFVDSYNDGTEGDEVIRHAYTHTLLDDDGRVVEEYRYASLADFRRYKEGKAGYSRVRLVDFTGERYGDKLITYYQENGAIICQIVVTGGKEEYIYDNFQ